MACVIRGPVLPHVRESLWSLVSGRLGQIETGLTLVLESLDCSDGQLGLVDGLARDAMGGPVLVLLGVEGDSLLPARALAAGQFLHRVGDALARAVPEASFCPGVAGRVLLVGTEASANLLEQVRRLPVCGLQVCSLEPFRIAGSERFAVRWLSPPGAPAEAAPTASASVTSAPTASGPGFVVSSSRSEPWALLQSICERIDPAVQLHGDRYARRITWNGHSLGEVRTVGATLVASSATGVVLDLRDGRDVRRFGDQLLRAYVRHAGLDLSSPGASASPRPRADASSGARNAATRHAARSGRSLSPHGESLRTSLAAARLSPEEYSAFDDPAAVAGSDVEDSVVAEHRKQQHASPKDAPPSAGRAD